MTPSQQMNTPAQLCQEAISTNPAIAAFLEMYLTEQERRRERLIAELRSTDSVLIYFGRLKHETLPRRVR